MQQLQIKQRHEARPTQEQVGPEFKKLGCIVWGRQVRLLLFGVGLWGPSHKGRVQGSCCVG